MVLFVRPFDLTEVSGEPAIGADGILLSCNEAESVARGYASLEDIVSVRKAKPFF
jgi:hypothetical protein